MIQDEQYAIYLEKLKAGTLTVSEANHPSLSAMQRQSLLNGLATVAGTEAVISDGASSPNFVTEFENEL